MAMGYRGTREAESAIASCRPFRNSTGSFYGTRGSTRTLGWLSSHADARRIERLLRTAVYVVWSYSTPIAWVSEDEDGERTAYYVDESHSATTSNHQGIARRGLSEYEVIGTRTPVRRTRPAPRDDSALVAAVGPDYGQRPDASLVGSPGYQLGRTESQQEETLRRLLDPRYANPDWTPFGDAYGNNLPDGAEARDFDRVQNEQGSWWRP
jgi:hypothetical protein